MPRRTDVTVTEQQTDNFDFGLLSDVDNDGEPESAINLSGVDHIEMWRRDNAGGTAMATSSGGGATLSFPGGFAAAGSVRWAPGTADLQASLSPYQYQFKVFRTASAWYYVPEDSWNTIRVRPRIG
jgi:hypothetical protein